MGRSAISIVVTAGVMLGVVTSGAAGAAPLPAQNELTVLSLNTWQEAGNVDDGLNKTVTAISRSGAQVVALQEVSDDFTAQIADQLGWHRMSTGTDVNVISSSPIEDEATTTTASGARVAGAKIEGIWIYSTHLDSANYGPYNACFDHDGLEQIYRDEENRKAQAQEVVDYVESADPTIVAGDLNSPSQYDWTERTRSTHCDYVVDWPTTRVFYDSDYWDSYREVNDDEAASPGNTWSPVVKQNDNGLPEPQDRIDFIQYKGGTLDATESTTYGSEDGTWPSDHLGVLTTFAR